MSNKMISMLKLRKIIQQLEKGKAIKLISKELRSSKNTIKNTKGLLIKILKPTKKFFH